MDATKILFWDLFERGALERAKKRICIGIKPSIKQLFPSRT